MPPACPCSLRGDPKVASPRPAGTPCAVAAPARTQSRLSRLGMRVWRSTQRLGNVFTTESAHKMFSSLNGEAGTAGVDGRPGVCVAAASHASHLSSGNTPRPIISFGCVVQGDLIDLLEPAEVCSRSCVTGNEEINSGLLSPSSASSPYHTQPLWLQHCRDKDNSPNIQAALGGQAALHSHLMLSALGAP